MSYSINFYLDGAISDKQLVQLEASKDAEAKKQTEKQILTKPLPVFLYLRFNSKTVKVYTERKCTQKQWDFDKQETNPRFFKAGSPEVNKYLNDLKNEVTRLYESLSRQDKVISKEEIKAIVSKLNGKNTEPEKPSFYKAYAEFVEVQKEFKQPRTIKKYNTLLISLKEFEKDKKYPVSFESITLAFYEAYKTYLLKRTNPRYKNKEEPLLDDTVAKYVSNIKTFMQWAFERRYHDNLSFKSFVAKKKSKNEIVTLTETELLQLQSFDFSDKPRLEKVRDIFLFLCFTGQRWSDMASFDKKDLKGEVWEFLSLKTRKKIRIPLVGFSEPALHILKKYDYVLPVISEQRFNEYLKEAGMLSGIDTPVEIIRFSGKQKIVRNKPKYEYMSSHMGRRTCVTLLLEKGVAVTTLMKITGHSDLRTLLKYENTNDAAVTDALLKIGKI